MGLRTLASRNRLWKADFAKKNRARTKFCP